MRRLTLLAAPAGAGKTTLLATLNQAHPELPLGWLALDATDDDPAAFLTLLLAALRRLHPEFRPQHANYPGRGNRVCCRRAACAGCPDQ